MDSKAAATGKLGCGVGFHPSPAVGIVQTVHAQSAVDLAKEALCPLLLMPARNDPADIKPKGAVLEALKRNARAARSDSVVFEQCAHGFMTRGCDDPTYVGSMVLETARAKALDLAVEFLGEFLARRDNEQEPSHI